MSRSVSGKIDRLAPQHSGSTAYINARIIDPTGDAEYQRRGPDQRRQDRRLRPQPVRLGRALRHRVGRLPRPLSRARPGRHARPYRRAGRGAQGDARERRRRRRGGRRHLDGAAARQRAAVRRRLADRVRRPPRPPDQAGEHVRLRRADRRARGQGAGRDRPAGRGRRRRLHRRRPGHRQRPGDAPRALLRQGLRRADRPAAAGADAVGRPHDQRRDGDAARPLRQPAARRGDDGRARHPPRRDDRRATAPRQDLDRRSGRRDRRGQGARPEGHLRHRRRPISR